MILSMPMEICRVKATRRIEPNPLDRNGRAIKRGEIGYIQDEADGFFFVEFGEEIAMCDKSEVRPA